MLYIKDGIFRDSKKPLVTLTGITIFNAPQEQWEAEGWKEYIPELEVQSTSREEKSLEELQEDLIQDAKDYMSSTLEIPISREERTRLRILAEDLLEEGVTQAKILDDRDEYFDLNEFIKYLKKLNVVEYEWKLTLEDHILAIELLETRNEIDRYDYTLNYSPLPQLP